jgi:hypothetical protein
MSKITRTLLHGMWSFDDETGLVTIRTDLTDGETKLDRVYSYSLARFLVRVFQRHTMKHRKTSEAVVE